jgi:hypothetical protein
MLPQGQAATLLIHGNADVYCAFRIKLAVNNLHKGRRRRPRRRDREEIPEELSLQAARLEWIPDQYKEKTPKDPTIREKFNTYRFADHKEKVIDLLLKRVTRVSVETMKIVKAMRAEKR